MQVLKANLISTALLARALMPELRRGQGSIVNVTSIAGSQVHLFAALTREMAHEFGRFGVRANAIAPGEIRTSILSLGTDELVADEAPIGRLGDPHEVANTIHILCSDASSYIHGAEIHIYGGQHV